MKRLLKKTKSKTGISSEQGGSQGTAAQPFGVEGELKGRGIHRVPNLNSNCHEIPRKIFSSSWIIE